MRICWYFLEFKNLCADVQTMTLMLFNGAISAVELQASGMGSSSLLLSDKVF